METNPDQFPVDMLPSEKSFLSKAGAFFLELIKIGLLAGLTIGLVRYFLFKPFYVKGQSMEPNFYESDYLIIDEVSYRLHEPERGDVVVVNSPINSDHYLKRIVGLPGERIKVDGEKVIIYNDAHPQGLVIEESYLDQSTPGSITTTLNDHQYYVMGDNRAASFDSRRFGPIDRRDIIGRVWLRGWPYDRITTFKAPSYNL